MEIKEFVNMAQAMRSGLLRQAHHYLSSSDDAEDAVQETLVKLWMAKEKIADSSKMRNMASVICRNVALNMLRSAKCEQSIDERMATCENPQQQLEEQERQQHIRQYIKELSDKQRAILKMRNVDNMSYADIARIIGSTESSVRGMISRARQELLQKIKGTGL